MNKNFLIILLLFLSFGIFAQNADSYKKGYQFSIKIKNSADTVIYFGHYFANHQYAIDTSFVDKKGVFKFKNTEKEMFPGMYFFATPSGKYFEILIDPLKEDINFDIETEDANLVQHLKIKGSLQNQLFYEYSRFNQGMYVKLDSIKKADNLSEEEQKPIREKFGEIVDSNKLVFMEKYPNHFLTRILNATKDIDIPPFPKDEIGRAHV